MATEWYCDALLGVDDMGGDWIRGIGFPTSDEAVHATALDVAGHHTAWGVRFAVLSWRNAETGATGDAPITSEMIRIATEIRLAYLASGGAI